MLRSASKSLLKGAIPRKLKWGIAGCGIFAESQFIPAVTFVQRSKIVSVYSSNISRARSLAAKSGAQNSFDNYDEFLKSDIDAVYISSVNSDHHWQAIKAAKAGKNILIERPIAINQAEAEEIVEVCKENNVLLSVNYLHRFHPLVQKAKELTDKQLLGKIVSITVTHNIDFAPMDNFRFNKELSGGGVLRDIGSQVVDIIRYFGGEITAVKSFMDNIVYKSEVEDFSSALLKLEKSGYAQFSVSYTSKKPSSRVEVQGHNGTVIIESLYTKKGLITKLIIDLPGEARKVFRKRGNKMVYMLRSIQKSFLKNEPLLVSGEDAVKNLRVIEEIENNSIL